MRREARGERLTPDEDQAMRRLYWFETLGCELSSALRNLKDNFRSRDRRAAVREPGATYDRAVETARSSQRDLKDYWAQQ